MLKTTIIAAAAASLLAFGATGADAKSKGHGDGHGGKHGYHGKHDGKYGKNDGKYGKHGKHGPRGYGYGAPWFNYSWYGPRCRYVQKPVAWDWYGRPIFKSVKVCN
jgi:hypothetical protein